MPKLHGYELARRIRALPGGKNVILLALTGWTRDAERKLAMEAGLDAFLIKPLDFAMFERTLASLARAVPPAA
jgi:CheY-like chemotaxis protein